MDLQSETCPSDVQNIEVAPKFFGNFVQSVLITCKAQVDFEETSQEISGVC